jgi:hypothetical protein
MLKKQQANNEEERRYVENEKVMVDNSDCRNTDFYNRQLSFCASPGGKPRFEYR